MVGRGDKWRAAAEQAATKGRKAVTSAATDLNDKVDGRAADTAGKAGGLARKAGKAAQGAANAGVRKVSETDRGGSVIDGANKVFDAAKDAPVITALADGIRARHGITALVERVQAEPSNPRVIVQLAEGVLRAEHDGDWAKLVRTVARPQSLLVGGAIEAVREADADADTHETAPLTTQLLARAYIITLARIDDGSTPADLHTLARIYLARGNADQAARFAQSAVALGTGTTADDFAVEEGEIGDAGYTLALAHVRRDARTHAGRAAELAVTHGCSLGNEITIELGQTTDGTTLDVDAQAALRTAVDRDHRVRYRGASPKAGAATWEVTKAQADKTKKVLKAGKSWIGGLRDR
ncbi:MAG: hypothetical protein AAF467_21085 [Actinomycetota bacterium]